MTYDEAIEILFRNYIFEGYFNEQWIDADDLADELLRYSKGGFEHVRSETLKDLQFRLSEQDNAFYSRDTMNKAISISFSGCENYPQLCDAAMLVAVLNEWIKN